MQPGTLLVANHISWLDIFAINAVSPAAFVAKDDILSWPLFGWLAARNETLFLRRGSRGHARQINAEIAELLETGRHVAVFPEGTTTNGLKVQHFHGALLQPALSADRQVQPLALSYWERGQRSLAARYDGEISLGQCLIAILRCRELQVRLDYLPPLGGAGQDRRSVSQAARQQIVDCLGLSDGATSAAATALSATP
jgi:1-acyl-sn-glycerol-3-phosphate acyltransferase